MKRPVGWAALATLAAAQVVLHFVTVRHDGFDGGPPRYGFPLPAHWAGPNSLELVLCPPAWGVDLLANAVLLAPLVLIFARGVLARPLALGLVLLALLVTGFLEGIPAVLGWANLEWKVPREHTPRRLSLGAGLDRQ